MNYHKFVALGTVYYVFIRVYLFTCVLLCLLLQFIGEIKIFIWCGRVALASSRKLKQFLPILLTFSLQIIPVIYAVNYFKQRLTLVYQTMMVQ